MHQQDAWQRQEYTLRGTVIDTQTHKLLPKTNNWGRVDRILLWFSCRWQKKEQGSKVLLATRCCPEYLILQFEEAQFT